MNPPGVVAYIGLGSNLDGPRAQLQRAFGELAELPHTQLLQHSMLYGSRPLGPADQPDYVNAVAAVRTALQPLQLLDALQAVEQAHHRVREQHWGPRTLDLDLLLYGEDVIDLDRLRVPHSEMHRRDFVLRPLLEIAPGIGIPGRDAAASLLADCPGPHCVVLND